MTYQYEFMLYARQVYLSLKSQLADCIVLIRSADYYEAFDDDARVVARVCDLILTSRKIAFDVRIPLVGVPYHRLDDCQTMLVAAGCKVAVVEQMLHGEKPPKGVLSEVITTQMTLISEVQPWAITPTAHSMYTATVHGSCRYIQQEPVRRSSVRPSAG